MLMIKVDVTWNSREKRVQRLRQLLSSTLKMLTDFKREVLYQILQLLLVL